MKLPINFKCGWCIESSSCASITDCQKGASVLPRIGNEQRPRLRQEQQNAGAHLIDRTTRRTTPKLRRYSQTITYGTFFVTPKTRF